MSVALVAIGGNLGDRRRQLDAAVQRLRDTPGIIVVASSSWHETAPVGGPAGQSAFLNGALLLNTPLGPEPLRQALAGVENELGRTREIRWQSRSLDLDLLLYDQLVLSTPELVIPHPRMAFRRFVLEPAGEIAPDLRHPLIGWTVAELLAHLNTSANYVALTGPPGTGKTRLADRLAAGGAGIAILQPGVQVLPPGAALLPGDSASLEHEREIKFVDDRTELLRLVRSGGERPAVSDFWLEQSLAYASLRLIAGEFERLQTEIERRSRSVVRPRLVVVLKPEPADGRRAADDSHLREHDLLAARLTDFASRPGVGPLLELSAEDEAGALAELQAAIDAMR